VLTVRRLGIGLSVIILAAALTGPALASKPLPGQEPPVENGHKVTICHATSSSNPSQFWEAISVDVASSGGRHKLAGHVGHAEDANNRGRLDVIPRFTYDGVTFDGNDDPGIGDRDQDGVADWDEWQAADPEFAAAALACVGDGGDPES
jgi:hypothetical protein